MEAVILDPQGRATPYRLTVRAQAVVLAAGAVFTPWLLLRNRIGPRSQIGRHLRIHPGCGVVGLFDEEIFSWRGVMQSYYVDEWLEEGILLEATFPPPGVGYSAGVSLKRRSDNLRLNVLFPTLPPRSAPVATQRGGKRGAAEAKTLLPGSHEGPLRIRAQNSLFLFFGITHVDLRN